MEINALDTEGLPWDAERPAGDRARIRPIECPRLHENGAPTQLRRVPGEVAQLVEHSTENRGVAGSSPALATPAVALQMPADSSSESRHLLEGPVGARPG